MKKKRLENIEARNDAIVALFNTLHKEQRIRSDDCVAQCAQRYFLSKWTVYEILKRKSVKAPPPNKPISDDPQNA
jgi:hypothetical protein